MSHSMSEIESGTLAICIEPLIKNCTTYSKISQANPIAKTIERSKRNVLSAEVFLINPEKTVAENTARNIPPSVCINISNHEITKYQ